MAKEKSKRKSLLKRIATSAVAVACMFTLAQPFGSVLKATANDPSVNTNPMNTEGFPSTTEVVTRAAQLLGAPYNFGWKGIDSGNSLTRVYSTPSKIKQQGIDCSGLVFWTLGGMGYYTQGYANGDARGNSPIPTDTFSWLDNTEGANNPPIKKIGFKDATRNVEPVTVTYQKSSTNASSQPSDPTEWWKLPNGGEIAPGSIVIAHRSTTTLTQNNDHMWIYIGKFDTRDAVINYLVNKCGVSQAVADANTVNEIDGNPYWRIESTNTQGINRVAVTNGKSAKDGSQSFTVTTATVTRQDKGSLIINKKLKPVNSGEFPADSSHTSHYSDIKFALKVKSVDGLTAGKFVKLEKRDDGIYKAVEGSLLDSATASGAEGAVGANGSLEIQNLPAGTYTLVETTNVAVWENAKDQDVVITKDNTTNAASYDVVNETKYGNIEVMKYSADISGNRDPEINASVLENATFIIRNTTNSDTPYVNATGADGEYAYHGLYGGRDSATEFKLKKNNENGYLIVKNLPMYNSDGSKATYEIEETKTDSDFVLASKEVDIQFTNHKETVSKEIVNVKAPTSFDVTKEFVLGTVGAGQVSDAMYGEIKFVVKNSEGKYLTMDGSAANGYTFKSFVDAEASATVMNLDKTSHKATLSKLPKDTYTVVEKVDITKYLAKQGTVNVQSTVDGANAAKLINNELTGGFEIYKKTETMKNVSGIQFRIYGTTVTGRTIDARTSKTDDTGYLKVEGIPYGTYTLEECSDTVDGSYTLAAPQTITIDKPFEADADKKEIKNEFKSGKVSFEKKNPSGMKLAGFEFTLYAEEDVYEGEQIAENLLYSKGEAIEVMTTGENGEGETSAVLPYGYKYKLAETKAVAPYNNDSTPVTFTLVQDNNGESAYVVEGEDGTANEPLNMLSYTNSQQQGKLTIYKIDAKDNTVFLSGAEFDVIANEDIIVDGEVKYKKDATVAHGTTGEDGVATFELYTGFNYSLKETKAPEGYALFDDITKVNMKYDVNLLYTEQEVSIANSEKPDTPQTGVNNSVVPVVFAGIGAVVALGALILIARKKKSSK